MTVTTTDAAFDEVRELWTVQATDAAGNSARVTVTPSELWRYGSLNAAAAHALEAVVRARAEAAQQQGRQYQPGCSRP